MAVEKNLSVVINFYKNRCLPVITLNKKHLSKQVVKCFLWLLPWNVSESFLFQEPADLVTITEEILNGTLHFLCIVPFRGSN